MKFFHLSDLHIGLRLMNRDLSQDQRFVFREIAEYAREERPDAIVIAGDIYDKSVPSADAVALFDEFFTELQTAAPDAEIMMISGNHDSGTRLNLYRGFLKRHRVHMIGLPPMREEDHIEQVILEDRFGKIRFYLLPFVKPSMVKPILGTDENGINLSYDETIRRLIGREITDGTLDPSERNVLVSHQFYVPAGVSPDEVERSSSEVRTVGNIDSVRSDVLESFDYAALGHIHRPMKAGRENFRYCGTPMPYSVDEAGQKKGILCVEAGEKGDVRTRVLPLKPLRQVRVIRGSLKEVLHQASPDYVTAVLTDEADLDVFDMQDRMRNAFPNLLEIRRETGRGTDAETKEAPEEKKSTWELILSFLDYEQVPLEDEDRVILKDVLNTVSQENPD
ncbi:MAG: exonuclease SbcCD subunit D [Bilifractor sp.]|jgi:exonuclease SbcD